LDPNFHNHKISPFQVFSQNCRSFSKQTTFSNFNQKGQKSSKIGGILIQRKRSGEFDSLPFLIVIFGIQFFRFLLLEFFFEISDFFLRFSIFLTLKFF
jgi:hypothetical protein